jgi:glutamine transport system substrate-binding protein
MMMTARGWLWAAIAVLCLHSAAMAGSLTVGCDTDFKPFSYKGEDGKYTGFDIELWAAVAQRISIDYRLVPMNFSKLIPALTTREIDAAIAGITITAERERKIDFSFPYYSSGLLVMVQRSRKGIDGIGDLDDKVVATKKGTTSERFAKNIQTREILLFPNIEEAYAQLLSGRADAVIFDSAALLDYISDGNQNAVKVVGPLYHRSAYGFAFPEGSDLEKKVTIALLELIESGEYTRLYRRWFGTFPF